MTIPTAALRAVVSKECVTIALRAVIPRKGAKPLDVGISL